MFATPGSKTEVWLKPARLCIWTLRALRKVWLTRNAEVHESVDDGPSPKELEKLELVRKGRHELCRQADLRQTVTRKTTTANQVTTAMGQEYRSDRK